MKKKGNFIVKDYKVIMCLFNHLPYPRVTMNLAISMIFLSATPSCCGVYAKLKFYPRLSQKCIKNSRHVFPPQSKKEGIHFTCTHVFSHDYKTFKAHTTLDVTFNLINPSMSGKVINEKSRSRGNFQKKVFV